MPDPIRIRPSTRPRLLTLLLGVALLASGCNRSRGHLVMVEGGSELRAFRAAVNECRRFGAIAQPVEERDGTYIFRCIGW